MFAADTATRRVKVHAQAFPQLAYPPYNFSLPAARFQRDFFPKWDTTEEERLQKKNDNVGRNVQAFHHPAASPL